MTTENIIHFDELFALIQKSKRAIANTKNESAEMVVALSQIETEMRKIKNAFEHNDRSFEDLMRAYRQLEEKYRALFMETQDIVYFIRFVGMEKIKEEEIPRIEVQNTRGAISRVLFFGGDEEVAKALRYGAKLVALSKVGHVVLALPEFVSGTAEMNISEVLVPDVTGARFLAQTQGHGGSIVLHALPDLNIGEIESGSRVLVHAPSMTITDILPEKESNQSMLHEIPTTRFEDLPGLDHIISRLKEEIAWPIIYKEVFDRMRLPNPTGFTFVGPPGTGKTETAKALINYVADVISKRTGEPVKGHFFLVGGSDILSKWLGDTEAALRAIYRQAVKASSPTSPVLILFDEADGLFGARGMGVSSDYTKNTVTQMATLMQGVSEKRNIIIIFTTNRQDMMDSALLRAERVGNIVPFPYYDASGAEGIFHHYLHPNWDEINSKYDMETYTTSHKSGRSETHEFLRNPQKVADYLIQKIVKRMFDRNDKRNRFVWVKFVGEKGREFIYGDFCSGATIKDIVVRAKRKGAKRHIESKYVEPSGILLLDFYLAVEESFASLRAQTSEQGFHVWFASAGPVQGRRIEDFRFHGNESSIVKKPMSIDDDDE